MPAPEPVRLPVCAVVPARDAPLLSRALAGLVSGTHVPAEVVVVDDGSRVPVSVSSA